jgi:hypothetical protein
MSDKQRLSKAQQQLASKRQQKTEQAEDNAEPQVEQPDTQPRPLDPEKVPEHRRCPWCWGMRRGLGRSYSVRGARTYYRCKYSLNDQFPCGRTWTSDVVEDREDMVIREIRRIVHE